jgi:hypothetical protein
MKNRVRLAAGLLLAALSTMAAEAQIAPRIGVYAGGMSVRLRNETNGRVDELTNQVLLTEITGSLGLLAFEGLYAEGRLKPVTQLAIPSELVEGRALVGIRPIKLVSFMGGIHARSSVTSGTRRRYFWELHAGFDTPIVGGIAGAHLGFWGAVSGGSNVREKLDRARGAEAALMIHVPRSPVWGKLGMRVERALFDAGLRSETLESLSLSLGIGLPGRE